MDDLWVSLLLSTACSQLPLHRRHVSQARHFEPNSRKYTESKKSKILAFRVGVTPDGGGANIVLSEEIEGEITVKRRW